jgi:hypothetical protein
MTAQITSLLDLKKELQNNFAELKIDLFPSEQRSEWIEVGKEAWGETTLHINLHSDCISIFGMVRGKSDSHPAGLLPAEIQDCLNQIRTLLEKLALEGKRDLYGHNYTAAIPLLEKGSRLGNSDAMWYLAECYSYGFGVPVDIARARQLMQVVTMRAQRRSLQVDREQQEERARSAREFTRRVESAASQSTYRSTPSPTPYDPHWFKGPVVATPYGLRLRTPMPATKLYPYGL